MTNYIIDIENWINRTIETQPLLGNFPICPFARKASYTIIELLNIDTPLEFIDYEVIIYKLSDNYTFKDLVDIADMYNKQYLEYVFLPDGNRYTEINGVQTNNGKHNLLLCQKREKLNQARKKLFQTNYYEYWNKEYLKEILNQ